MKYLLVRHGESVQNTENGIGIIDAKVELSERGKMQTKMAVDTIKKYINEKGYSKICVYYSPYVRTEEIANCLQRKNIGGEFYEEPLISEIQCGDFWC